MKEENLKFYELVRAAYAEAMREGIIANAIVINEKMVKVKVIGQDASEYAEDSNE